MCFLDFFLRLNLQINLRERANPEANLAAETRMSKITLKTVNYASQIQRMRSQSVH